VQSASLLREITGSSAESETLVAGFKAWALCRINPNALDYNESLRVSASASKLTRHRNNTEDVDFTIQENKGISVSRNENFILLLHMRMYFQKDMEDDFKILLMLQCNMGFRGSYSNSGQRRQNGRWPWQDFRKQKS
jgi:hypothetical protein